MFPKVLVLLMTIVAWVFVLSEVDDMAFKSFLCFVLGLIMGHLAFKIFYP